MRNAGRHSSSQPVHPKQRLIEIAKHRPSFILTRTHYQVRVLQILVKRKPIICRQRVIAVAANTNPTLRKECVARMPTPDFRKITDGEIDGERVEKLDPGIPVDGTNGEGNAGRILRTDAYKRWQ